MNRKTRAEINTNNNFMFLYEAEKQGKQDEWYKRFNKEYRKLTKEDGEKLIKVKVNHI